MRPEIQEIYDVLATRPEIKEIFDLLLSLPEEKRNEALKLATDYLKEVNA